MSLKIKPATLAGFINSNKPSNKYTQYLYMILMTFHFNFRLVLLVWRYTGCPLVCTKCCTFDNVCTDVCVPHLQEDAQLISKTNDFQMLQRNQ